MDRIVVAAQDEVAQALDDRAPLWLEVVAWSGDGRPARDGIDVWVPPYLTGLSPQAARRSLDAVPEAKVIQLLSAGVEPWPALLGDDIVLCSGRGIHGGSTAELAVGLLLALARELPTYVDQQRDRHWRRHPPAALAGRRALVLGAGDIGTRVAAVLRALEVGVTLAARRPRDGVVGVDEAWALLPEVDVLVVALPLTSTTSGLVDARVLAALPDGAIVVNIARGAIVDTDALTREVAAGRLCAGLDVTDPEPLPANHPLWTLPGALITPHVGGGAEGWLSRAVGLVRAQLHRLHDGEPLANVVGDGY